MGKNNIWLVKFQKLIPICIAIAIAVFIYHNFKHSDDIIRHDTAEFCYKPMIKVDDIIYYYDSGDVNNINIEKYKLIGEVKFLSASGNSVPITQDDKNFSSNWYPVGTKIYRYDDNSVLVYREDGIDMLSPFK